MTKIGNKLKTTRSTIIEKLKRKPMITILVAIVLVAFVYISARLTHKTQPAVQTEIKPKTVSVYHIGKAPRLNFQAKVEKKNVITIVAQTGGVVQSIYHSEGQTVNAGDWLVGMTTNYQGDNVASLQRQVAQKQYNTVFETYPIQKELISKQRTIANKTDSNNDALREISYKALANINEQVSLDKNILSTLDSNLSALASASDSDANRTLILQTKQLKSQYLSAVGQLESSARSINYQTNDDETVAKLSNLAKEVTLKQLDLQEKSLDLNKELSELSLRIAQIGESLMYPSAPFAGKIEKIYVKPGQLVSAGTTIAMISGNFSKNVATVYVPQTVANSISKLEESTFTIDGKQIPLVPTYISTQATDGQMYSVVFNLPADYSQYLTDGQYVDVSLPVGYADTGSAMPFVPLDAVAQTQDETTVYVAVNNKVEFKPVTLGNVYGRFVQIKTGLNDGDIVILDRNIVAGDLINF